MIVSRALHPFLGWLLSWSQGIWLIFFWIGFNAWFALVSAVPSAFITIGSVTGGHGWITAANDLLAKHSFLGIHMQWYIFLFGTVLNILFALRRVAPVHCCTGAPKGPCMRVSAHTAQASR